MSEREGTYIYKGNRYPEFLKHGDMCQFILPVAKFFCRGRGYDVGPSEWPFPGATPIELKLGMDAMNLPGQRVDYVFSSHCLEHLDDPIEALKHWHSRLFKDGVLFLYLPHPDMTYWLPQHCTKHRHSWKPEDMAQIVTDLGFVDVMHSERDLAWSYCVVGYRES
jgi:SAM-dependent methyltransferase